ncbi:MAG: hypothetical protein ACXWBI_18950 [Usitatibacter sp.]
MPKQLRLAITLSIVLVLVDAFVLSQGGISLLVGAWLILVSLPMALFFKRYRGVRLIQLASIGVGLAAVATVFTVIALQNRMARHRAEAVIAAVEAFHADQKRYPDRLEQLVPKYLESVPRAKYTLMFGDFMYHNYGADPTLMFTALPPFGRPTYRFAKGKWGYLD